MATKKRTPTKTEQFNFKSKAEAERACGQLIKKGDVLSPEKSDALWRALGNLRAPVDDGRVLTELLAVAPAQLDKHYGGFGRAAMQYLEQHGPFVAGSWVEFIPRQLLLRHSDKLSQPDTTRCLTLLTDKNLFLEAVRAAPALRQRADVQARLLALMTGETPISAVYVRAMCKEFPEVWEAHRTELLALLVKYSNRQNTLTELAGIMTDAEVQTFVGTYLDEAKTLGDAQERRSILAVVPEHLRLALTGQLHMKTRGILDVEARKTEAADPIALFLDDKISQHELRFAHANPEEWKKERSGAQARRPYGFHPMFGPIPMPRW